MTIAEVSKKYDISADTLRYYERIGLIPPVPRTKSGIRDYDEVSCGWIELMKCMRAAGVQIEALIEYVALFQQGDATVDARKAILIEQRDQLIERMEDMQRRRFEAVRVYEEAFRDVPQLRLQKTPAYCHHSRHLYVMRIVPERLTISRDAFIEELKARNVGVSVHFIALHTMSAYVKRFGYKPEDFPKAYAFSESEISLPMYSTLGVQNAQYVAQAVLDVVRRYGK